MKQSYSTTPVPNRPKIQIYSNITGMPYPDNPGDIQKMLASHILKQVTFKQQIENLFAAGGHFFVEFGPGNILTAFVKNILENKPHLAVALNASRKEDSDRQLREAVIKLRVAGLPLRNLDPYQRQALETPKQKGLTVRLNGASYVSDKTRKAFGNALQEGHQVSNVPDNPPKSKSQWITKTSKAKALDSKTNNQTSTESL